MPSRRRGQKGRRPAPLRAGAARRPRPPPVRPGGGGAPAGALTGEATVHLWLVDDERRELRIVAESGARPGKAGLTFRPRLRVGEGLAGEVARTREPLPLPPPPGARGLAHRGRV